jgi:hypothetical protein
MVYSTGRDECHVMRLLDLQRRGLVICCPWRQSPAETLRQVRHLLTPEEAAQVAEAFGLDRPDGAA